MTDSSDEVADASALPARDHIVVIGGSNTALRLVDELERAGEEVLALVVTTGGGAAAVVHEMAHSGAVARAVADVREQELTDVHVRAARSVVVLGFDDVFTTRVALLVEELNPDVRLVLELSNPNFSERLSRLLGECVVLSSAQLAAPAFIAAGMTTGEVQTFNLGGRMVSAGPRERIGGEHLAVLGDSDRHGIEAVLPEQGDLVLGTTSLGRDRARRSRVRTLGILGAVASIFDRRLRWVIGGLLMLMLTSVLYFHSVGQQSWLMSTYLALTASTLTGIGDTELPLTARFGAVVIQLLGLILSSGVTAVIVDALIKLRIRDLGGGVRGKPRHHAVVCGLGRIGTSVMQHLHDDGIAVVAIEQREDGPGVLRARRLKVPVIIAEATDAAALEQAGIDTADAVLAVTDSDAVNLEIALVAKQAQPEVRVVTRLFDHDLANRVEDRLELGPTRSVSMLAAPAFAAAAMGRSHEVVHPVGRRVVLFTEIDVTHAAGGSLSVDELQRAGALRVLAVRPNAGEWDWSPAGRCVRPGDRLALAATRDGLSALLHELSRPGRHQHGRDPGCDPESPRG